MPAVRLPVLRGPYAKSAESFWILGHFFGEVIICFRRKCLTFGLVAKPLGSRTGNTQDHIFDTIFVHAPKTLGMDIEEIRDQFIFSPLRGVKSGLVC